MQRSYNAHREFKEIWNKTANKQDPKIGTAREAFFAAHNELWSKKLDPLQARFHTEPAAALTQTRKRPAHSFDARSARVLSAADQMVGKSCRAFM